MKGKIRFFAVLWLLAGTGYTQSADSVRVSIHFLLEGPYQGGSTMSTALKDQDFIPSDSPYDEAPKHVAQIPENSVDWVLVELRTSPLDTSVAFESFLLCSEGSVTDSSGSGDLVIMNVQPGNYFIVIRHRNHLSVMSGEPAALNDTVAVALDFTSGSGQYYGAMACKEVETGVWAGVVGDVNGSGIISYSDREGFSMINAFGYLMEDLNMSGIVTYADKELIDRNLNRAAPCYVDEQGVIRIKKQ